MRAYLPLLFEIIQCARELLDFVPEHDALLPHPLHKSTFLLGGSQAMFRCVTQLGLQLFLHTRHFFA